MVPEQLDGKNLSEIDRTQDNHNQIAEGIFNGFKYYFLRKHSRTHAPTNFYQKFHMMYFIYKLLCIMRSIYLAFENLRENCIEVFDLILKSS